ncbi:hypothetical protein ACN4EG_18290 [Alkalinema pantanalense CENA528]|uniref:hypothetical protein n=1 Tax=Alkalinema pantanalense TaxID=1620705 RepID=UPI003D6F7190
MAASIEQLNQSLAELDKQVADLGETLRQTYGSYLDALQKNARQQLILAAYHVCTEGFPEEFLRLSVSQREMLQSDVRSIVRQAAVQLTQLPTLGEVAALPSFRIQSLEEHSDLLENSFMVEEREMDDDDDDDDGDDDNGDEGPDQAGDATQELAALLAEVASVMASHRPPSPIDQWLNWQEHVERSTRQTLRKLSHQINQVLQRAGLISPNLPDAVLEAASRAEGAETMGKLPHVVQMLVEGPGSSPEKPEKSSKRPANLMHIVAVQLRLSELEFNDPETMVWRRKVRELTQKMKMLGREYRKRQRQRSVAEAQVAWRSTWIND